MDGTKDEAVWDEEGDKTEDPDDIYNEFETKSIDKNKDWRVTELTNKTVLFKATPVLFRTTKHIKVNGQHIYLLFITFGFFAGKFVNAPLVALC